MKEFIIGTVLGIIVALLVGIISAHGQEIGDFGVGHAEWHHWYQTGENGGPLKIPNSQVNCCDDDCRPTKAKFENGRWYAYIDRQWELVPEGAIKENIESPNGMAHICASRREAGQPIRFFCFVKPRIDS